MLNVCQWSEGFPYKEDGEWVGGIPPNSQKFAHPSHLENSPLPPQETPPTTFLSPPRPHPPKVNSLPLNNNFHVITQ